MNDKIKICFVVLGTMYSGAEIVLNRFLKANSDIDPYILLLYKNEEVTKKFEKLYGRERVFTLNFKFSQWNITFLPYIEKLRLLKKYKQIVKSIYPDIIYINNTTETMLVGGMIKSIPNICHIHDMKSLSRSPIRMEATIQGIKKCEKVVTVSEACRSDWNMDMEVIYNGINEEIFEYKKTNGIKNIGFIGTPIKRKGIDIILDSLDVILSSHENIRFNFAFNKEIALDLQEKLYEKCEKYKDRIKIFKELSEKEVIKFYDDMDLIIVPSRHDPLPTVIMEAEARGTLVIGSGADGITELLNNKKDLIMDTISCEGLINEIERVLNLNLDNINQITQELFQYCKDKFSSKNKNKKLMNIIYGIYRSNECEKIIMH